MSNKLKIKFNEVYVDGHVGGKRITLVKTDSNNNYWVATSIVWENSTGNIVTINSPSLFLPYNAELIETKLISKDTVKVSLYNKFLSLFN